VPSGDQSGELAEFEAPVIFVMAMSPPDPSEFTTKMLLVNEDDTEAKSGFRLEE
jgi:hypothetical protein